MSQFGNEYTYDIKIDNLNKSGSKGNLVGNSIGVSNA
jgi:hypothetical protein